MRIKLVKDISGSLQGIANKAGTMAEDSKNGALSKDDLAEGLVYLADMITSIAGASELDTSEEETQNNQEEEMKEKAKKAVNALLDKVTETVQTMQKSKDDLTDEQVKKMEAAGAALDNIFSDGEDDPITKAMNSLTDAVKSMKDDLDKDEEESESDDNEDDTDKTGETDNESDEDDVDENKEGDVKKSKDTESDDVDWIGDLTDTQKHKRD